MTPLEQIYTADEAAERLRLTTRAVIKLGKIHGLCSRQGRNYFFSEADIVAIWEALREPAKEVAHSRPEPALSGDRLSASLRALTARKKRGRRQL